MGKVHGSLTRAVCFLNFFPHFWSFFSFFSQPFSPNNIYHLPSNVVDIYTILLSPFLSYHLSISFDIDNLPFFLSSFFFDLLSPSITPPLVSKVYTTPLTSLSRTFPLIFTTNRFQHHFFPFFPYVSLTFTPNHPSSTPIIPYNSRNSHNSDNPTG